MEFFMVEVKFAQEKNDELAKNKPFLSLGSKPITPLYFSKNLIINDGTGNKRGKNKLRPKGFILGTSVLELWTKEMMGKIKV